MIRDRGAERRHELTGWLVGGCCIALTLGLLGGVGFVVYHFVAKFW